MAPTEETHSPSEKQQWRILNHYDGGGKAERVALVGDVPVSQEVAGPEVKFCPQDKVLLGRAAPPFKNI